MINIQYPDFSYCVGGLGLALALNSLAPPQLINGPDGVLNRIGALFASNIARSVAAASAVSAVPFVCVYSGCFKAAEWLSKQGEIYHERGQELRNRVAVRLATNFFWLGAKSADVSLAAYALMKESHLTSQRALAFAVRGWEGLPLQVAGARAAQPNQ